MTFEELRLVRTAQAILVRSYVDTQKLEIDVTGHMIHVEGELQLFDYHPAARKQDRTERDMSIKRMLLHIEQQIRAIPDVAAVEFKLTNWERVGNQWLPKSR